MEKSKAASNSNVEVDDSGQSRLPSGSSNLNVNSNVTVIQSVGTDTTDHNEIETTTFAVPTAPSYGPFHRHRRLTLVALSPVTSTSSPSLPLIPVIHADLRFRPFTSVYFADRLNSVCSSWTPEFISHYGISTLLNLVTEKIFRDSAMQYNVFLLDATICPTSSVNTGWLGPGARLDLGGSHEVEVRFRTFFQANGKPYVIHIFDSTASDNGLSVSGPSTAVVSVMKFTLEYMHVKFQKKQLVPDIFAKAAGTYEVLESEKVKLKSPTGQELVYPKTYIFYTENRRQSAISSSAAGAEALV
ncbi:unnamed protein product [Orchesella dallaii]|uniref:Uncharacterized protein n=1 Tax=Orchesella dallaii TaxID=48710 RepID=A0ABP1Q2H7_9HEXA